MKPVLLHLHLYYREMWPDLRKSISDAGMPEPYTLWVTLPEENADLEPEIRRFHGDCKVTVVENRGFDIAPFLHVLANCGIDGYSYIIKLHSKRNVEESCRTNGWDLSADTWRKHLMSFMSPGSLARAFRAFQKQPDLGMVGDYHLIYRGRDSEMQRALVEKANEVVKRLGYASPSDATFVAGTMFLCRAELLKPLLELKLQPGDFPRSCRDDIYALPYVMERVFGLLVCAQGFRIGDPNRFSDPCRYARDMFIKHVMPYIYRHSVNAQGRHHLKIFKIPLPVNTFLRLMAKLKTDEPSDPNTCGN